MFNPIAILSALIAPAGELPAAEIDFAEEDTQEIVALALHTRPIDTTELHDVSQLENALVDYQPFHDSDAWHTGNIAEAKFVGSDVHVLIIPTYHPRYSFLPTWRNLRTDSVDYAWYE